MATARNLRSLLSPTTLLSFLALSIPTCLAAAQPTFDFNAALSPSTSLQGQTLNLPPFDLHVLTNETHALFVLNATTEEIGKVGYMAVGWGNNMATSDMVILWPNNDDTWTLSHRSAPGGHHQPSLQSLSPSTLILQPSLTTYANQSLPYTHVSFLRPLSLTTSPNYTTTAPSGNLDLDRSSSEKSLIFAYSGYNPGEDDVGSKQVAIHDGGKYGRVLVDLTKAGSFDVASGAFVGGAGEGEWTWFDRVVVAHAVCGGLAWAVFAPFAVLVGRFGRHLHGTWFKLHQNTQMYVTLGLTVVTFALGVAASNAGTGGIKNHFVSNHQMLGLAILVFLLLQLFLGWWIHHKFDADRTKRPFRNILHMAFGLLLLLLGYTQILLGFSDYTLNSIKGQGVPGYVRIIFGLVLVVTVGLYGLGVVRLVRERQREGKVRPWTGLGRDDGVGAGAGKERIALPRWAAGRGSGGGGGGGNVPGTSYNPALGHGRSESRATFESTDSLVEK